MLNRRKTISDLLEHPDRKHLELVDGRFIERGLGAYGAWVSAHVMYMIGRNAHVERSGWLFSSMLPFRCFPEPDRVRHVSMSYVKRSRLPALSNEPFSNVVPDLIVELTPHCLNPDEVPARIDDFLAAGTPLAWVVNYKKRFVLVRRPCRRDLILRESDTLTGGNVLPGFTVQVANLFPQSPGDQT